MGELIQFPKIVKINSLTNEGVFTLTVENIKELGDFEGYRSDFLATSGFAIPGVDYEKDVERYDVI